MTYERDEPIPLPRWLLLPLGIGLLLTILGLALPWLYPQQSLWTEEDAKQHTELALQAHAAHHASANAQTNNIPTVKQDMAKAKWYREQFDLSEQRLKGVREGGSKWGNLLSGSGIALTAFGVVMAMAMKKQ